MEILFYLLLLYVSMGPLHTCAGQRRTLRESILSLVLEFELPGLVD